MRISDWSSDVCSSDLFITRKIPVTEVLDAEGLEIIERNADTILEEIGIEFRDDEEALKLWKDAGADVQGTRIHFPRGLPRGLIQKTAHRQYTQHARNPERTVELGEIGRHTGRERVCQY